jgi:hypothetical protein
MRKHLYILLIGILLTITLLGQKDTIYDLGGNNVISSFYNTNKDHPNSIYKRLKIQNKKAALSLPFLDDFSQANIYPNLNLWEDINVYVNSNFPDNPISYGVATFDGLDSTGTPYNFAVPTSYGPADTLTSKQIDLTTINDSVFLSFYYQPQGNGNKPEARDSLRLEFFRQSDSTWVRMWGMEGLPNQVFKQVMLPVDTSYHTNEFQFRFMNWATLSGNVDHWHLDYVYLNDNRTHADTALNDVSFITNHHNMLNELTSLPWSHYLTDTIGLMKTDMDVTYRNNHNSTYAVFYNYEVIEDNGSGSSIETYPTTTSSKNVTAHSNFTEPQAVYNTPNNDFFFPSNSAISNVFQIKNYFNVSPSDFNTKNDTVCSYQVFSDYYAYDDGSAELGYGVQGVNSKLAQEFDIKKADTLTAIQIYFNPIMNDLSAQTFRLKVWSSLSPEVVIYTQPATQYTSPVYSNTNEYINYTLETPLYLTAGTYYFGWEKITAAFLNVGWDVNTNNRNKVHFNSVGTWEAPTSSIPDGSLMLRPVFGHLAPVIVSTPEMERNLADFKVYPNPTQEFIYFKVSDENQNSYRIELLDIYGKLILQTESNLSNRLNVKAISNGLYIVRFTNNDNEKSILKKIIISK